MSETEHFDPTSAEPKTYGDGQFSESLDPPKADELPFSSDREGIEQAIEERSRTAGERNAIDVIQFQDGQGHVEHGNKTVSPEHAADELKAYRERKAAVADQQLGEQLAAAVDEFRGVSQEQPEPQPRPDWTPEVQQETAPPEPTELDHLLADLPAERRAPFVQAYAQTLEQAQATAAAQYNQHITQAQQAEHQYRQGIVDAAAATASLLVAFPELDGIRTNEQLAGALAVMQRQSPERHAQLAMHVQRVNGTLNAARQQVEQEARQQQQPSGSLPFTTPRCRLFPTFPKSSAKSFRWPMSTA